MRARMGASKRGPTQAELPFTSRLNRVPNTPVPTVPDLSNLYQDAYGAFRDCGKSY